MPRYLVKLHELATILGLGYAMTLLLNGFTSYQENGEYHSKN